MRPPIRTGLRACGVFLLAAVLSGCATSQASSKPVVTTYVGSTSDTAVLLAVDAAGTALHATLEIARTASGRGTLITDEETLVGTLREGSFDLRGTNGGQVDVRGTFTSKMLSTRISIAAAQSAFRLLLVKSTPRMFERAKARIASALPRERPPFAGVRVVAEVDVHELRRAIATLTKAARALTSDASALDATYAADAKDFGAALSASSSTSSAVIAKPTPSHKAVCEKVASLDRRLTTVANDEEFLAGFISGLEISEGGVATDITSVKSAEAQLQELRTKHSVWIGEPPPTSRTVTAILDTGAAAIAAASSTAASVSNATRSAIDRVFASSNDVIASADCGGAIATPPQFSPPLHA